MQNVQFAHPAGVAGMESSSPKWRASSRDRQDFDVMREMTECKRAMSVCSLVSIWA